MKEFFEEVSPALERAYPGESSRILMIICHAAGGSRWRIPSMDELERIERDRQIRTRFRGHNLEELAARYSLSLSQVRRIVRGE